MSAYKTVTLSRTGDGALDFTPTVTRWRTDGYPANSQISVTGLPSGAVFHVDLLPAGETEYKRHITDATGADLVMLSGKEAPIFAALRVIIEGTTAESLTATLTLWERGI
jgi:hypothetical protein